MIENPYASPDDTPVDAPKVRVYRDSEDEFLDNSTAVRIIGAVVIAIGCYFAYSGVYTVLAEAIAKKQSIYVSSGAVGFPFICLVCGVIMLVAGRHTRKVLMHRWYDATPLNISISLVIVALAISADIYFQRLLTSAVTLNCYGTRAEVGPGFLVLPIFRSRCAGAGLVVLSRDGLCRSNETVERRCD